MKKNICILLTAVLLMTSSVTAFAAKDTDDGVTPTIVVSGLGACPFYIDEGTQDERYCFPPQPDVPKLIYTVLTGIVRSIVRLDIDIFADTVVDVMLDLFGEMACDEYGNSKYPVTPVTYSEAQGDYDDYLTGTSPELQIVHTLIDEFGGDNVYFYNYDWRLDPVDNADNLDAFIEKVLDETDSQKVNLVPCSMGGVQTLTYLYEYGSEYINSVVFMSSADNGLLFVGNLFSGDLTINQYDAFQFLPTLKTGNAFADLLISRVCNVLATGRLFNGLFKGVNLLVDSINDTVVDGLVKKTFSTMPGIWSFVTSESYEASKKMLLTDATPEFIAKLDYFQYNIRANREKILSDAVKNGVKISYCSHYDKGSIPVTSAGSCQGDILIETTRSSGGAYCAQEGKTLPEGYIQQNPCSGHNHISPDNIIDASTCTFPDSTWFIKGMQHVGCYYGSDYGKLLVWLLKCETQPTVFDNTLYPQFLQTDAKMMTLAPVN